MSNELTCTKLSLLAVAVAAAMGVSTAANAITYNLAAKAFDKTLPDGTTVTMWGYALDGASCAAVPPAVCAASAPGPALEVPAGDDTLTVNLTNNLGVPVSIVIPGQITSMSPVMFSDARGRARVKSFTAETAPGATQSYTWTALKPGTYLYHSGTHPQVQVQMGLYGAVMHDAGTDEIYAGVGYDSEAVLLYSEIDPALHAAVADNSYGTAAYPSTINYLPKYFLVNGEPYLAGTSAPLLAGNVGQRTLLRFLNAGLKTHVPVLDGQYLNLVAEDGRPYPYPREQYSVMLPALKTVDAILTPTAPGRFALFDRRLDLTTGAFPEGGMLAFLNVAGSPTSAPVAVTDTYGTTEDGVLAVAAPGVLENDTGSAPLTASLVVNVSNGILSLQPDGSFNYTPNANYSGPDGFSYKVNSGTQGSNTATVAINVAPENDMAVAAADAYRVVAGGTLQVDAPGVLGNDSDLDGDTLTAVLVTPPAAGTLALNANGSFSYTAPATAGTYTFTYQASDGTALSSAATVTITAAANASPVAVSDNKSTTKNVALPITVVQNDYDPDTAADPTNTIDPTTVRLGTTNLLTVKTQRGGTATVDPATGIVTYTPFLNFRGTDYVYYTVRDTLGAISNRAVIRINVM